MQTVIKELVDAVRKRQGKALDALHWVRMTALDISGEAIHSEIS